MITCTVHKIDNVAIVTNDNGFFKFVILINNQQHL